MSLLEEAASAVVRNKLHRLQAALSQEPSLLTDRDSDGYTLLHRAAFMGSTECLRILLAAGACTKATSTDGGMTALCLAAGLGHEACVRELLAAGANVEAAAAAGRRPLHVAALGGHLGCLQQLLDAGADCNVVDDGIAGSGGNR
ncbi:hypothetical protein CHLNCDRAFT_141505 [Chlorella variabilis]|uniref:Uncharacterized protein n=1 Tax=Chlorella variabilis TaxID=554065 RepID=E1ZT03_CHLVA|nr:hypothetical protein CHLNCDRAFT_141505 [Chlorella variabilis]EFN51029.1 hypothetical protein CHLNCDRAFT_141505 [Chlorella variabilis]|eukprot:XP_005843131.1 hypothetical protein CHLNCDRAFT_141505 [Chlorella variabilis]